MDSNVFNQPEPNTGALTFEEAKTLLGTCKRFELRDHAFGDREIIWCRGQIAVAEGYFGGGSSEVWINEDFGVGTFTSDQAKELAACGAEVAYERNDETGPDEYRGA